MLWNENRNHCIDCNYLEEKGNDIFEALKFQECTECNQRVHRETFDFMQFWGL